MNEELRRIQNFLTFLNKTWKFITWVGVLFLLLGTLIFSLPKDGFSILGVGIVIIGGGLLIRSQVALRQTRKQESFLNRAFVICEIQELKKKINVMSLILVLLMIVIFTVIFTYQFRYLIPSLIAIMLYVVAEYVTIGIIIFRLSILENELFKNENS